MMNHDQSKRVEFMPPEGFNAPEHEGEEFDLVCTFRVKPSGEICMTKLGDTEMPGYDDKGSEAKENKPDYKSMANNLMGQDVPNAGAGY